MPMFRVAVSGVVACSIVVALGARYVGTAEQTAVAAVRNFACPMHPDVVGAEGDTCPRCGMRLVPIGSADGRMAALDLRVIPQAVAAGQTALLKLGVHRPASNVPMTDFEALHGYPVHVFLVAHDLEFFAHLHPAMTSDGSLELPFSIPRPGIYHAFVEFMPRGGIPQLLQRAFVTGRFHGRVTRNDIQPDVAPKVDRTLRAELQLPADGLVAGREQSFRFTMSDAASGAPVADLQPYLGSLGHLFLVSTDLSDAAHVHPIPDFSDTAGPKLVFQALFPRPGVYRLWVQVQRAGELFVMPFTVPVGPE